MQAREAHGGLYLSASPQTSQTVYPEELTGACFLAGRMQLDPKHDLSKFMVSLINHKVLKLKAYEQVSDVHACCY